MSGTYTSKFDGIEIDQLLQKTKDQQEAPDWAMAPTKPTYTFNEITSKPEFYPVDTDTVIDDSTKTSIKVPTTKAVYEYAAPRAIPWIDADANTLIAAGTYYLTNNATNRPVSVNGWLEVFPYRDGSEYCYQRYTTYKGAKYERIKTAGVWEQWCGTFTTSTYEYTTYMDGRIDYRQNYEFTGTWLQYPVTGLYYQSVDILLPKHLIKSIEWANAEVNRVGSNVGWIANLRKEYTQPYSVMFSVVRNGNTGSTLIEIGVRGKWK